MSHIPTLLEKYRNEITKELREKFNYKNVMEVPKIKKIVINMGIGLGAHEAQMVEDGVFELSVITGQKPVVTKAKKAISNFKIRKDSKIGCKVTLRRKIMYEFLERLINVAIPRIKDFKGLETDSFDGRGNYTFGLTELLIFPEIEFDKVKKNKGMDITIVTSAETDEEARELLKLFGFPFKKES